MADLKCYVGKCSRGLSLICLSTLSGILAPVIFLLITATAESLEPGYNPIQDTISQLVLGVWGGIQTFSFFLLGFLYEIFTWRLYAMSTRRLPALVGTILFSLSGLGIFFLGFFPPDASEAIRTFRGMVHSEATVLVLATFVVGCLSFALYFRKDSQWHKFWWFSLFTAVACLIFALIWKFHPSTWALGGLDERLIVLLAFIWTEVISIKLLRHCFKRPSMTA
jgi:hypothetical membrane protein